MARNPAVARIVRAARSEAGRCPRCRQVPAVHAREVQQGKHLPLVIVTGRCACTTPGERGLP